MANLKIGVAGCGRIGKLHINNLINSVQGVEVAQVADPMRTSPAHASGWQSAASPTYPPTLWISSNNPEIDVVFVCSSTDTHCDISMAAVQAGKPRILREADRL